MKIRHLYPILPLLASLAIPAVAEIKLPSTAKQLKTDEIRQMLSGKKTTWKNVDNVSGTAEYSADVKTSKGTLINGEGKTVNWDSKVALKKDQYCFSVRVGDSKKRFPQACYLVFADGKSLYEVDPKTKKVQSINTVQ
jgi:alkylated DNA nucleotide flippase Atl1